MPNRPFHPPHSGITPDPNYARARYANFALGSWLIASAFIWPHFEESRANTWIVGALICLSSVIALRNPAFRWGNTLLAGWLFASTLLLIRPLAATTLWNNLLVAAIVFTFSLVASGARAPRGLRAFGEPRSSPPSR